MIDRTPEFLKAIQACRNNEGIPGKTSILTSRSLKPKTPFGKHCTDIVTNITKLRDFLVDNRKAYIGGVGNDELMSDRDRDKIDADSQRFMKTCSDSLKNLKEKGLPPSDSNGQVNLHKKYTIELIEKYLKSVCRVYSEQRAIRVKQVVDKKRISRLQTDSLKTHAPSKQEEPTLSDKSMNASNSFLYDSEDELSPEDEAVFEQENVQLLTDMNSMMDEVKVIEGKVVEIARLQELFSEQVFQQEGEIELVAEKIAESSENVKDGNEELREAIKNNAGFRVWVLFFLVMCSFSLLFLEWYS